MCHLLKGFSTFCKTGQKRDWTVDSWNCSPKTGNFKFSKSFSLKKQWNLSVWSLCMSLCSFHFNMWFGYFTDHHTLFYITLGSNMAVKLLVCSLNIPPVLLWGSCNTSTWWVLTSYQGSHYQSTKPHTHTPFLSGGHNGDDLLSFLPLLSDNRRSRVILHGDSFFWRPQWGVSCRSPPRQNSMVTS